MVIIRRELIKYHQISQQVEIILRNTIEIKFIKLVGVKLIRGKGKGGKVMKVLKTSILKSGGGDINKNKNKDAGG